MTWQVWLPGRGWLRDALTDHGVWANCTLDRAIMWMLGGGRVRCSCKAAGWVIKNVADQIKQGSFKLGGS